MLDLAVIIVTWNVRDLVLNALQSLYDDLRLSQITYAVTVVDDGSSDETPAAIRTDFPEVQLIVSDENLGFGRANNLAMRSLGFDGLVSEDDLPRVIYLLNADTITKWGATQELFDALMAEPEIGLVGANLSYADGSFQHGAFVFPGLRQIWAELFPTPGRWMEGEFNGRYPRRCYQATQPFSVDFILGATMMLKREVILQTGTFDESFFMYCEEIDWAWRIHKAGWSVKCVPTAEVIHLGGQSTSQIQAASIIHLWTSRLRLFQKYYPQWKVRIARWMIAVGMRQKLHDLRKSSNKDSAQRLAIAYQSVYEMARDV